jgi:hypothetical protein
MKSPLKFLAGLIAWGRAAESPQALTGRDPDTKLSSPEVRQLLPAPDVSATAVDDNHPSKTASTVAASEPEAGADGKPPVSHPIVEEAVAPVKASVVQSADDAKLVAESASVRELVTKPSAERASRKKAVLEDATAVKAIPSDDRHVAQSSVPALSVSNEAVSLDDEIAALRKQLAQKLRLQNAQLRTMLERFDHF